MWDTEDNYKYYTYRKYFMQNSDSMRLWARMIPLLAMFPFFVIGKELERFFDWAVFKEKDK